jgi:hypothetical protein
LASGFVEKQSITLSEANDPARRGVGITDDLTGSGATKKPVDVTDTKIVTSTELSAKPPRPWQRKRRILDQRRITRSERLPQS